MEIAKVGDVIQWSFPMDDREPRFLRGRTFTAKVAMVDIEERHYGVYAEYGQDLIDFDNATIVKPIITVTPAGGNVWYKEWENKTTTSHDIFGDGKCCCNCANQIELFKHPGNKDERFRGPISESTGLYACICQFEENIHPHGIITEWEHSVCEMWQEREGNNENT